MGNRKKTRIRQRMAQTGEKYDAARRAMEPYIEQRSDYMRPKGEMGYVCWGDFCDAPTFVPGDRRYGSSTAVTTTKVRC